MKFSIVIPLYNAEFYFDECVKSVVDQSYTDWEMIVVDDGSSDGSPVIADRYAEKDNRIKVIHKQNEGQLYARRDGIQAAQGDYVICLDSDDWWDTDCLSVLNEQIEASSPDLIMFPCRIIEGGQQMAVVGNYADETGLVDKKSLYEQIISSHMLNSMSLKAFKRELTFGDTTDYSAFKKRSHGEDKIQTLHIITSAKTVIYIDRVLYNYRRNPTSVSNDVDFSRVPALMATEMFEKLYDYMTLWNMDNETCCRKYRTYFLRHFNSVFYKFRRICQTPSQKKTFRKYDWKRLIIPHVAQRMNINDLTFLEKTKLFIALHASWVLW